MNRHPRHSSAGNDGPLNPRWPIHHKVWGEVVALADPDWDRSGKLVIYGAIAATWETIQFPAVELSVKPEHLKPRVSMQPGIGIPGAVGPHLDN